MPQVTSEPGDSPSLLNLTAFCKGSGLSLEVRTPDVALLSQAANTEKRQVHYFRILSRHWRKTRASTGMWAGFGMYILVWPVLHPSHFYD